MTHPIDIHVGAEIDLALLPNHLHEDVRAYIDLGRPTGGFLATVINGNFNEAAMRADPINRLRLDDIFTFFEKHAPTECHGSPAKRAAWIKRGGLQGEAA